MSAIVSSLESSCAPRTSTLNKTNRHSRTTTSERTPMMVIDSLQRTGTHVRSGSQRVWPLKNQKLGFLGISLLNLFLNLIEVTVNLSLGSIGSLFATALIASQTWSQYRRGVSVVGTERAVETTSYTRAVCTNVERWRVDQMPFGRTSLTICRTCCTSECRRDYSIKA